MKVLVAVKRVVDYNASDQGATMYSTATLATRFARNTCDDIDNLDSKAESDAGQEHQAPAMPSPRCA